MQLSTLHSNNGAVVQTESSVALASLANQLIRRQGEGACVGWGGKRRLGCICVTRCGVQSDAASQLVRVQAAEPQTDRPLCTVLRLRLHGCELLTNH